MSFQRIVSPMVAEHITVVGGGVRSGKSAHALALARTRGTKRAFIATAQALDEEMTARILRHQQERGDGFTTREAPHDLLGALQQCQTLDVVVIDCVTLWLSNRLLLGRDIPAILDELAAVLALARSGHPQCIFVTNEVGMGIVPESALGRAFRDLSGLANQALVRAADGVRLAALGLVLRLCPGPVTVVGGPLSLESP